ncbi:MAG: RagB/SusD family nutrient uptake outer membrane protein [Bacteroidota bacterium]|nr:RagB/SusD family nutrient uptake outer membrane protein [Bacteroidota bacterium]
MKNIYILFPLAGALLFSACKKQLNQVPISQATTATFYASPTDFIQGVNAVYNDLRGYPDRLLNLSETRSDNLYAVSSGGVRDWDPVNNFQKTQLIGNAYVTEAWASNYNGIYRANVLLDQLKNKGAGIINDAALRTRLEAETRFLRAFFYFDLVRYFGKVPLVDKPITAPEALALSRSPVVDVYKLIIDDLTFAANNLPDTYAASERGRITKWAAKGILALVYMTRSGPTYGIEGPGLGVNEWVQALTSLNEIIASNRFSLLAGPNGYANIFSFTNENNAEVVFDIQYITGSNPVLGSTFAWLLTPDTWFQSQGKPLQGSIEIRPVSNDLVSSYEPNDIRKGVTIHSTGYTYQGVTETRPFYKKYVDISKVPSNRVDWPINFIVMRYADVLLLKAECILHGATPGTQADVDALVNQIRQRAGLGNLSNVNLEKLMDVRRREFAAEGLRWHDLVRSGLVESVMTAWIAKEDVLKQIQPFNKNYIIYPIPQSELDVKQGLYAQNPGY